MTFLISYASMSLGVSKGSGMILLNNNLMLVAPYENGNLRVSKFDLG